MYLHRIEISMGYIMNILVNAPNVYYLQETMPIRNLGRISSTALQNLQCFSESYRIC